ncbi:MAG: cytochrome c biogenesis protein CcsA [Planctomycetes bacterium]|nr:cytochrome c biogenesis protein CcsA [Planctomycetota bacterium]
MIRALAIAIALLALAAAAPAQMTAPAAPPAPAERDHDAFVAKLDLTPFATIAVYRDGRVKTFESFARETMSLITGPRSYRGQPATVTYLDLMIRPDAYVDADIIYVKSRVIRAQIADTLEASIREQVEAMRAARTTEMIGQLEERVECFRRTGLLSEPMLMDAKVVALLGRLDANLMTSARFVRMIETGLAARDHGLLRANLRVVPPVSGAFSELWLTLDEFGAAPGIPDSELRRDLTGAWDELIGAWRAGDAMTVNAAAARIARLLPRVNEELYPAAAKLRWERRYFVMNNLTWVWMLYCLALVPLILHVVYRWRGARWLGLGMFVVAFFLHTVAVLLRWYVAGRWPNTNMFEAITTAAWFGGCFALLLEVLLRRTPVRSLLALGSAAASMFALMVPHFLPLEISADINNTMPVLHDVWLYIHTNIIIFSYALIFIASISAVLYLVYRASGALRGQGGGGDEYARVGGAGSLIMSNPGGGSALDRPRTTFGQVLDGTTMIVLELAFILLWAGIVMGAIWADHSWGRPWGWDPKEVFALNTFIIFLLLVHTRIQVRDKGLWTALLAIAGCVVMLFNWIVINFTISGLHSYA